jgi:hypothetical protein
MTMENQINSDYTDTVSPKPNNPDLNNQAAAAVITFIIFAITVGVAIALLIAANQQRKPKTFREKLEHNLSKTSEATAQAFRQLSRDIDDLRKSIENRR